jgi:hypothetical protein
MLHAVLPLFPCLSQVATSIDMRLQNHIPVLLRVPIAAHEAVIAHDGLAETELLNAVRYRIHGVVV